MHDDKPKKGLKYGDHNKYENEDHRLAEEDPKGTRIIEEFGKKLLITNAQFYYIWPLLNREERKTHFDNVREKGVRKTYVTKREIRDGHPVNVKYLTNKTSKPQI